MSERDHCAHKLTLSDCGHLHIYMGTGQWALMTKRKFQNPSKITFHGNFHSTALIQARRAAKVPS